MGHEQFAAMMPYISADLVSMIVRKQNIAETDAMNKLYASKLYGLLEKEETKLWQYSTDMLYSLFVREETTGHHYINNDIDIYLSSSGYNVNLGQAVDNIGD